MKWLIGAVILAFVAWLVSGHVSITWVVYIFAAMFISIGLALVFAFSRTKHHGLLLLGICYIVSAVVAIVMTNWWPLLAGYALVWTLRAMGMDPGPEVIQLPANAQAAAPNEPQSEAQNAPQSAPPGSDKKS